MNSLEVENWFYQRDLVDVFYLLRHILARVYAYRDGQRYFYGGHLSNYVTWDKFNYQDLVTGYEMIPIEYNPLKTKAQYDENTGFNFRLLHEIKPSYHDQQSQYVIQCPRDGDILYGITFDQEVLDHIESCYFTYDQIKYQSTIATSPEGRTYYTSGQWYIIMLKMQKDPVLAVIKTKNHYPLQRAYLYYQLLECGRRDLAINLYQWHE